MVVRETTPTQAQARPAQTIPAAMRPANEAAITLIRRLRSRLMAPDPPVSAGL